MATTRYPLTKTEWTDCGAAPCFIQSVSSDTVLFVVDTAAPESLDAAAHVLWRDGEMSANVGLTGKIFARAGSGAAALIVSR